MISARGGGYGWAPELKEGVRLEERSTAVYGRDRLRDQNRGWKSPVLATLIRDEVATLREEEQWEEAVEEEERGRTELGKISARYQEVVSFLEEDEDA